MTRAKIRNIFRFLFVSDTADNIIAPKIPPIIIKPHHGEIVKHYNNALGVIFAQINKLALNENEREIGKTEKDMKK